MSQSHAAPERTNPLDVPEGQQQALCCQCGQLRIVSRNYWGGTRIHEPFRIEDWGAARCTITLKCEACQQATQHAFIRNDRCADYLEPLNRCHQVLALLRDYWPDWRVEFTDTRPADHYAVDHRTAVIEVGSESHDLEGTTAQAIAHIVLTADDNGAGFDDRQIDAAELADLWLDRIGWDDIADPDHESEDE